MAMENTKMHRCRSRETANENGRDPKDLLKKPCESPKDVLQQRNGPCGVNSAEVLAIERAEKESKLISSEDLSSEQRLQHTESVIAW